MMTFSAPPAYKASMHDFIPGMNDSQPSRPNLFAVLNLTARKLENSSAHIKRLKIFFLSAYVSVWYCLSSI